MYSETSLFRILKALDLLVSLSLENNEGYEVVEQFSEPENISQIIELSVEASTYNQIMT